jgi:arginyl-tRNA synthetase
MRRDFDALGVQFDLWKGEADAHDLIQPMINDLIARGIAEESEGALVVHVAAPVDKHEVPPLILTKSSISANTCTSSRCSAPRAGPASTVACVWSILASAP